MWFKANSDKDLQIHLQSERIGMVLAFPLGGSCGRPEAERPLSERKKWRN